MGFFSQSETDEQHTRFGLARSRFTYRNLSQLASSSVTCPLRVIAHIDLDAFYAQCETVRLGIPEDKPLAVQQWLVNLASLPVSNPLRPVGPSVVSHPSGSILLIHRDLSTHAVPEHGWLLKR